MFENMKRERKPVSRAGATPFHRRTSYIPLDEKQRFKWLIFDNDGSFNGWFDWLPLWMRVGYWNPLVVVVLVVVYVSIVWFKPQPLEFSPFVLEKLGGEEGSYVMGMPKATAIDLAIFSWGIIVMIQAKISLGSIRAFPISFTGWSWLLLTSRAGLEFSAWAASKHNFDQIASKLATVGSSIRLVAISNACVVCTVWNLVLLPIIYFKSVPPGEKRTNFIKFNFGFFMTNIHILNFPLAFANILSGDRVRLFNESDLWVAYLVIVLYSVGYFFIMDRLGLHFYPIFNPRTIFSIVSIVAVLGLYWKLFHSWNNYITQHFDL
jgi:hypothetical protein